MEAHEGRRVDVGLGDLSVAVVSVASLLPVVVVQLFWMIAFDSTGLDAAVPHQVFMVVLPALTVAVAPLLVAGLVYGRRGSLAVGGGVLVLALAMASVTVELFAVCGVAC